MRLIEKVWFQKHYARWWMVPLLLPFTIVFAIVSAIRRLAYQMGILQSVKIPVPVVIVGNIGVGGNGKTPVCLYLVEKLTAKGLKVGVVSRGYGSQAPHYPYQVNNLSTAEQAGDEPLLIYKRTSVPVVIGADRVNACQMLVKQGCEIIIADDGLQHYRLARDFEFVVIDGKRLFGNGLLLPAGPLRETKQKLAQVDCVIVNGDSSGLTQNENFSCPVVNMRLSASKLINVKTGAEVSLLTFIESELAAEKSINAIAGIGDPSRFFNTLEEYGFNIVKRKGFVDHQAFTSHDLQEFSQSIPLLMTEKDAVKCASFANDNYWYLPVDAEFLALSKHTTIDTVIERVSNLAK